MTRAELSERFRREYSAGVSIWDIAEKYNRRPTTVALYLGLSQYRYMLPESKKRRADRQSPSGGADV